MNSRKILLLTLLVLLLFGFIYLFERKLPTTSEAQQKKNLIWEIPEDQVDGLRLERPDSSVELKKTGTSWRLVRPESYPADSAAAGDVVSQLARLRRAGGESAEARPEDYGLSPAAEKAEKPERLETPPPSGAAAAARAPATRATILWKDPENPTKRFSRTLEFGVDIPGTDAAAARVAGGSTVIFVPASLAAAVRRKADDFRSKDVFSGLSDVSHVDIERGRGRVSLVRRDGSWWLSQPFTDLADSDFAQRLVDELTSLKAIEFVSRGDRANLASLGLTPPLYRVTLTSGQGKPPVTAVVELGATQSDGNTMYARRESQVFTVPSSIVEDLSKEAVAFRDRRLVRFDRANVSAIEGVFGAERFALQRKDSGWLSEGKPLTAPADDLMSAILDLKARTFLDDAQAAALKGRAPAGQVTVKVGANESWTVLLHPSRTDTDALVSNRPGAFLVSGDAGRTLLAAFRRATGKK